MTTFKLPLFFAALVALSAGCKHFDGAIIPPLKDFEAFDSPRDFDPPGRVFRIDQQGVIYGVGQLSVTPKTGNEVTKKYSSKANWSLETVLKTAGVAAEKVPAVAKLDLERQREVSLESTKSVREYIDDEDQPDKKAEELLGRVGYKKDNKYFVIRETVATTALDFKAERKWLADLNLEAEFQKVVSANSNFKFDNDKTFSLVATFDKPMRVWYKIERLSPKSGLGVGPNEVPSFSLKNVSSGTVQLPARALPNSP